MWEPSALDVYVDVLVVGAGHMQQQGVCLGRYMNTCNAIAWVCGFGCVWTCMYMPAAPQVHVFVCTVHVGPCKGSYFKSQDC